MKPEIDHLIELLEQEKALLQSKIDECLGEADYEGAAAYSNGLAMLNRKLQILHTFKDPNYEKKRWFKALLERTRQELEENDTLYMKGRYQREKQQLDDLEAIPIPPHLDSQQLDELIEDVTAGKITAFKLHLNQKDGVYLRFSRPSRGRLLINFPSPISKMDTHFVGRIKRSILAETGFVENQAADRWEMRIDQRHHSSILHIKERLARVFYDALPPGVMDQRTYVEIEAKDP